MKRKIPSLRVASQRAVGAHACNAEVTFAKKDGEPSTASRLLGAFHERENEPSLPPLTRYPCVGPEATRRANANDVDLNHPFCACRSNNDDDTLVFMYNNTALDCLQSYLDALVELGRMDDTRLGVNFFREWKQHVVVNAKKRKSSPPLGALSLQNWALSDRTIRAMVKSEMGENIGALDLTGVQGLTDELLLELLPKCPNLVRLSLKNCRRITQKGLASVKTLKNLTCLDVGGSYNLSPRDVLDVVQELPHLKELHASGIAWTDDSLMQLVEIQSHAWNGLSIGFSHISSYGLREVLPSVASTLTHLAVPFLENSVDNAMVGFFGKTLLKLVCLDIRGNTNVSSLTGFFDGRQFSQDAEDEADDLFVLARYSNVQASGVEETKRIHPLLAANLVVVIDAGGVGGGIRRRMDDYSS